jgi:hypothetical protein
MNQISLFHVVISSGLLPRGFRIKILYEFLIFSLGITGPMPPCLLSITHTIAKKIGTFSPDSPCPQKAYTCNSSDYRGRPVFQVGHHFELPQLFLCAYASNHVTMNTTRPLSYWSTAFGISTSSASRIIGLVIFFPLSY